jgi:alkanesulfonate monooxygenase SsuD/methylene tetrahydromethanopterin reductase-like flavin-dependent oxidoreductase (luciferase family)
VSRLKWGLTLPLAGELSEPGVIAEIAASAEAVGWDGIFVWDHLWNRTGEPFADPWVTLAAVAVATERVRLGPLVTPLPRRRSQVVAQQAATLDRLSGGRLTLGLGLGHDRYGEYSAFDEPQSDARARADRLDAGLELLVPALSGLPVPSAGPRQTTIVCVQKPRCPIWVAATLGKSAGPRRAARHGLEGVALVGAEAWSPEHVSETLSAGGFASGAIDVVLVGGTYPDPPALAAAGATWAVPEVPLGSSRDEALAAAAQSGRRGADAMAPGTPEGRGRWAASRG